MATIIFLAGCTSAPVKFSAPDKDAPEWDLNVDEPPDTNDLFHEPVVGLR